MQKREQLCKSSALVYSVRIPGFHPGGPGSIPGCGIFLYIFISYNNTAFFIKHTNNIIMDNIIILNP